MINLHRGVRKEEKIARKIAQLLWDLSLDLEAIGYYLARATNYVEYCRVLEILESAQAQKEDVDFNRLEIYNERLF
jgi:hypothetical protein